MVSVLLPTIGRSAVLRLCICNNLPSLCCSALSLCRSPTRECAQLAQLSQSANKLPGPGTSQTFSSCRRLQTQSYCTSASESNVKEMVCQRLLHRRLIRVAGPDTLHFLQGLVTNNVLQFADIDDLHAMYAMMLNVQVCLKHMPVLFNCLFH